LQVDSLDQKNFQTCVDVPHAFWFWNNKENDLNLPEKMARGHYDEFDYAYAITCHKSQGSQWDKVVVFDESGVFGGRGDREDVPQRWLYTAVTRAAEAVVIVR
jgi:exodeoxyribonuclease-5